MKKIVTILMLIAAILIGGATVDAKTKKKSKARSSTQSSAVLAKFTYIRIPDDTRPVIPAISGHWVDGFDGAKLILFS